MESLSLREILRSKEEQRILTGRITGIEKEYYKLQDRIISCAIVWYEDIKVLIPVTHLGVTKENKSLIRGMLNAEVDFIACTILGDYYLRTQDGNLRDNPKVQEELARIWSDAEFVDNEPEIDEVIERIQAYRKLDLLA